MDETVTEIDQEQWPKTAGGTVAEPAPRGRAKLVRILLVAAVVVAATVVWVWLHYQYRISTDDAQVDGHIAPISAKISGSVLQVLVDNNQRVAAGAILVTIDPRDYQARLDQAKAALALAESQAHAAQLGVPLTRETTTTGANGAAAQVAQAEAELNKARIAAERAGTAEIATAQANVEAAEASNSRAQADLARMKPLAAKEEISQQQYDSFTAASRVAQAQLRAAQERLAAAGQTAQNEAANVNAIEAKVQVARAMLAQARAVQGQVQVTAANATSAGAAVDQARAGVDSAALMLGYATITAPIDGVVTRKTVEPGQIVAPGQGLMTIIPLHDVWVTANFKETQLADVRPGQKAEVHVDMYSRTIEGRVDSIAGATGTRLSLLPPENATGNFVKVVQRIPVKIVFDSLPPGVILRPGMNVDATIITR
jgi:membrane fusion protein (multidrug efflux system)